MKLDHSLAGLAFTNTMDDVCHFLFAEYEGEDIPVYMRGKNGDADFNMQPCVFARYCRGGQYTTHRPFKYSIWRW